MNTIIDFHTHAFPDELAARAMAHLQQEGEIAAHHDGTVAALLASMDAAGIDKSVLCSIATKPAQFAPILAWSQQVRSERIIPLPSVHPDDPDCAEHLHTIKQEGFAGIKMHPYYQEFYLDAERLFPLYEALVREELLLVMHTGFDIAFPAIRYADPERILAVTQAFPELKLITTHLGAWKMWDEVAVKLIGKNIYMEISFALEFLSSEQARAFLEKHPAEYILFGTDSPWTGQRETLTRLQNLGLAPAREQLILSGNAGRLLAAFL